MNKKFIHTKKYTQEIRSNLDRNKSINKIMNGINIRDWIKLSVGLVIIVIGLVLFLINPDNYYFIALMMGGIFLCSSSSKLEDMIKQLN